MAAPIGLKKLIVSAPFGNYIQPDGCTPTLGTFTAQRRPGRVRRVLLTVRYYRRLKAWVNRIGLRNPGMLWLVDRARNGAIDVRDKIVSIHGFNEGEWETLLGQAADIRPLAIELNMSCPNVGEINFPQGLFEQATGTGIPVIVKLPPVHYRAMGEAALAAGIRTFHCCNTLPIPAGGMSGKPLKPFSTQCIADLRERIAPGMDLTLIGGGGITQPRDIDDYASVGATHFAIATKVFNPKYLWSHKALRPLIDRAQSV